MIYIEYTFKFTVTGDLNAQTASEILVAELGERNFESFVEEENVLLAYIQKEEWNAAILEDIALFDLPDVTVDFTHKEIEQENWNATWEQNFEPIYLDDQCTVRAPFHEKSDATYDIIIEPKMSFGTGHHETTRMMLQHILETDCTNKSVLDMGSGTGVLAILAALKGATPVEAIDIDNWCYLNALENVQRNNCQHITVKEGDASLLGKTTYDIIIANINRNILLADIPVYASCLNEKGILFLSGFYEADIPLLTDKCKENGISLVSVKTEGDWRSLRMIK